MHWTQQFETIWLYSVAFFGVLAPVIASAHAVLHKRDSRAALLWVGVVWLLPVAGAGLYLVLGVNRIRRRAVELRGGQERISSRTSRSARCTSETIREAVGEDRGHIAALADLVAKVTDRPLVSGNKIEPLLNGDEAYPAMVDAIRGARKSVSLSSYIFDNDAVGGEFVDALADAFLRRVEVRVILDDTGSRYSWPPVVHRLRRRGVEVSRFLPILTLRRPLSFNLRNHRKILVVDGEVGFTGGLNIRAANVLLGNPARPTADLHFRLRGPVVAHLQEAFADDLLFCTREILYGTQWFPPTKPVGDALARGIADGPDEDFDKLRWTLLGALSCARESVQVVTPYFLPDQTVISALNLAAMRGVQVDVILPERSNLPPIHWATFAILWQILERGCRVWLSPRPFDHTKLALVDDCWSFFGSANWDSRSLRLNFEFNVECYSRPLAHRLREIVRKKLDRSRPVTLKDVDGRSLPIRLRDGVARLLTPYL